MSLPVLGRRFASLLTLLLVLGATSWVVGCDFTRVDEGADLPIQQHVEALAAASTPDAAERAIRGVLNKVGVRTSWQADVPDEDLAYGTYFISDAEIRALAEEHARFVAGQNSAAATIQETHAAVVLADNEANEIIKTLEVGVTRDERGPIVANALETTAVLQVAVSGAVDTPETPLNAMALAITAEGATLPTASTALSANRTLSPAQRFLFSVWLHHNGPLIYPFLSGDVDNLPVIEEGDDPASARIAAASGAQTYQPCDACCGGSGKFISMTLLYIGPTADVEARILNPTNGLGSFKPFPETELSPLQLFSVDGTNRPANGNGVRGTIGNNVGIYADGAKFAQIHTSCSVPVFPGMVFGKKINGTWHKVLVVAVATGRNGLCSNLHLCVGACKAQLIACKINAGHDDAKKQACYQQFRDCDANCHDQGGIY